MAKYIRTSPAYNLIADIQDALCTEEAGQALVEVARNAYKAQQELAAIKLKEDNYKQDQLTIKVGDELTERLIK